MVSRLAIEMVLHQVFIMETVAAVAEIAEAQLIRSVLEGHGIKSVIPNEQTAEIAPPSLWASGGVVVQVDEADVETAKAILATTAKEGADAIKREQAGDEPA